MYCSLFKKALLKMLNAKLKALRCSAPHSQAWGALRPSREENPYTRRNKSETPHGTWAVPLLPALCTEWHGLVRLKIRCAVMKVERTARYEMGSRTPVVSLRQFVNASTELPVEVK